MVFYGDLWHAQTLVACFFVVECYEFLLTLPITAIRYFSRLAANFSLVGTMLSQTIPIKKNGGLHAI